MIALLFVLLLILAIWLAVKLGGVRRRDEPRGSARRKDNGTIIGLPGDGSFISSPGTDAESSDTFEGAGGSFGGGGASGGWDDAGGDSGGDGGGGD